MDFYWDDETKKYTVGSNLYSKEEFLDLINTDMLQTFLDKKEKGVSSISSSSGSSNVIVGAENVLIYGLPGVGKSYYIKQNYCSNEDQIQRVVFHPEYSYSDFVGQVMPRLVKSTLPDGTERNIVDYVFSEGPFSKIMHKAINDPLNMYYLIIEEINRGDAPAIFGELFQLLDRVDDKSLSNYGESEYGVSNFDLGSYLYKDPNVLIKIPSNLTVLATMNTADQNVFTLDTAFQRRWQFKCIPNDIDNSTYANSIIEHTSIKWGCFAKTINELIINQNSANSLKSSDKRLGAYFVKNSDLTVERFAEKVLKYLSDDVFKSSKEVIFSQNCKTLDQVIISYKTSTDDSLKSVLNSGVYETMLNLSNN